MKRKVVSIIAIIMVLAMLGGPAQPLGTVSALPADPNTSLAVAVHVSETTSGHGISVPQWQYFQIYTLLEEALVSDGTPFVEVSDASIAAGGLLTPSGNPKYPIFISLAAECISDAAAQAIRTYVSRGGFAYAGSSAWTRNPDGSFRSSFALSAEMGLSTVVPGAANWTLIGDMGQRVRKVADHPMVNHLTLGENYLWPMPDVYDRAKLFASGESGAHQAWQTVATTATLLAVTEGGNPFLAIKSYGSGQFIYQSELAPLAGWGEGNMVLFEYTFFRKAIEWALATQGLPLVRVAAWPYPKSAAFVLRHDDLDEPPDLDFVAEEAARGIRGQYFAKTNRLAWAGDAAVSAAILAAQSQGASIGSHTATHRALDYQYTTYTEVFNDIDKSLDALELWSGTRPSTFVAPYFAAVLDRTMEAMQDNGLLATGGEQMVGPFPHYGLSMTNAKQHYGFVEVPVTFWNSPTNSSKQILSSNDGPYTRSDIDNAVDLIYSLGGVIGFYDHQSDIADKSDILYAIDYQRTKARVWETTHGEIASWWALRSPVQIAANLADDGINRTLTVNVTGAGSSQTALDVIMPQGSPVTVILDGEVSSAYQQASSNLKVNSGAAGLVQIRWNSGSNAFGLGGGGSTWVQEKNTINAMKFTSPQDGTLSRIGLLVNDSTPNGNVKVAIYDHDGGADRPRNLLWGSASTPVSDWQMEWATSSVALSANATYWLAFWMDRDNGIQYQGGAGRHAWLRLPYGDWPGALNTALWAGTNSNQFVMWASFTTSGGAINNPPTAVNDAYSATENIPLSDAVPGVLGNDADADGNPLTATLAGSAGHGAVTLNANGSFTYTPGPGYTGVDSFTYTAHDGQANSNVATVTITVSPGGGPLPGGTFGLDSGSDTYNQGRNMINAMKVTNTAGGTLSKIELLIDDATPEGNVKIAIYEHNALTDRPGNLLWSSASTTVTDGWMEWSTAPVGLTANTVYWLAYWLDTANGVRYQSGAGRHAWWAMAYEGWPPSLDTTWTGVNANQYVMRATYTVP